MNLCESVLHFAERIIILNECVCVVKITCVYEQFLVYVMKGGAFDKKKIWPKLFGYLCLLIREAEHCFCPVCFQIRYGKRTTRGRGALCLKSISHKMQWLSDTKVNEFVTLNIF